MSCPAGTAADDPARNRFDNSLLLRYMIRSRMSRKRCEGCGGCELYRQVASSEDILDSRLGRLFENGRQLAGFAIA